MGQSRRRFSGQSGKDDAHGVVRVADAVRVVQAVALQPDDTQVADLVDDGPPGGGVRTGSSAAQST